MLRLSNIEAFYGSVQALDNVSLEVGDSQIVCLLGANGAGKTTMLNCVSGLVAAPRGKITFDGEDITNIGAEGVVARGIVQVPEGREIFPAMNVEDNLVLGAWQKKQSRRHTREQLERIYGLFPRLRERARQHAGTLSGGEQQMLMIGRALLAEPKLIMFDEPSLGLSPLLVQQVFGIIRKIHEQGMPILLVEQNARLALKVSSYCYVIENGEIRFHGPSQALMENEEISKAYLG
ncbi:MAG TPA: ABC transporter ATP-binding protein [Bordetella sp.]